MKKNLLFFVAVITGFVIIAQPTSWTAKGAGGGGAMYSASISPHDANTFFISCDMSPVHKTTDFGQNYSLISYLQLAGNRNTEVQFTSVPTKLFALRQLATVAYVPAKSFDGGTTWSAGVNPCSNSAYQFLANPYDSNQVLLSDATKIYFSNNEHTGVYSTLLTYTLPYGGHLAGAYFENQDTAYVCTHDTLMYTFNGGASWLNTIAGTTGIPANEHIVSFEGTKQGGKWVFYAVTISANSLTALYKTFSEDYAYYKGIYKLSQGSTTWKSIANLPDVSDQAWLLAVAKNDTSVVYVAGKSKTVTATGSTSKTLLGAVFCSTNSGASFTNTFINNGVFNTNTNITTGWLGKSSNNLYKFKWNGVNEIVALTVDPNNSSRIVIGDGMMVHTSIDKGSSWQQAYTDFSYDNAPGVLISPTSTFKTSGLETTSSYWLSWISSTSLFASYNDILARRSVDGGNFWSFDMTGLDSSFINDINMSLIASNGYLYAACGEVAGSNGDYTDARASLTKGRITVSKDNGLTWTTLTSFGKTVSSIAFNPKVSNGMYATLMTQSGSIGGVYYCSNILATTPAWTKLTSPPRTEARPLEIKVLSNGDIVAVYGSRDGSITSSPTYSYTLSSGVFYSNDGGNTWADNNPTGMQKSVVDVEIDPNDATESTWLAFVGNNGSTGGIYRTTNKGINWTLVYNQPTMSGTFHPLLPNELYVCGQKTGLLYATGTNSNNFIPAVVSSYPFRIPQKVFFNPYDVNEVWVASFGNGFKMGKTNLVITNSQDIKQENQNISLYPNPVSDELNFSDAISKFSIVNTFGQVVYETNKSTKSISTQNFADGLYFVKGVDFTLKFIVKH